MKTNYLIKPYNNFIIVFIGLIYFLSFILIESATIPLQNTLNDTSPYLKVYNGTNNLTNKTLQPESQLQSRMARFHDVDFDQLHDDSVFGDDDVSKPSERNKRKRQRSNTQTTKRPSPPNNAARIEPAVFSNPSTTTSMNSKNEDGRSCPNTEIDPNITSSLSDVGGLFGAGLGIGGGLIGKAVAICIIIGIIWVKIVIAALIAWWWWGSGGDKFKSEDNDDSPVYGPPKQTYGPPAQVYGPPPTQGYGRQLYNSIDFNKLTDRVWRAIDFFEKYYNSSNEIDVDGNKNGRDLKNTKTANVEPFAKKKNS